MFDIVATPIPVAHSQKLPLHEIANDMIRQLVKLLAAGRQGRLRTETQIGRRLQLAGRAARKGDDARVLASGGLAAWSTFGEVPLVENAHKMSPGRTRASTCRAKTRS